MHPGRGGGGMQILDLGSGEGGLVLKKKSSTPGKMAQKGN
jgi:hypothetical protein